MRDRLWLYYSQNPLAGILTTGVVLALIYLVVFPEDACRNIGRLINEVIFGN